MNRIKHLFQQLGYTRENGLFYLSEADQWVHKFPYRISNVLKNIIKPDAFYSLHHHGSVDLEHPEPINNPIILFFDKPEPEKRAEIPKWSFCFGQAPIVIINTDDHGPLDIFHGYQFESDHNYTLKSIDTDINTFSLINLTLGKTWKLLYHRYFKNVPKVDKFLLNNIVDARRILIAQDGYGLAPRLANRLIGRLLFVRYMIDRHVDFKDQSYITGNTKTEKQVSLNNLLLNKEQLYQFFYYLTDKYQGDLFPLNDEYTNEDTGEIVLLYDEQSHVTSEHLGILYHLFSGSHFFKSGNSHKGYVVQPSLFMVYDFEVIPVELISNIYENFIGKEEENYIAKLEEFNTQSKQYSIKAYYTPPFIVDYVLSQTVTPFLESNNSSGCRILDPACGSGIFLVETLRKVIEKEILLLGGDKKKLNNIRLWKLLKDNIYGIDIDDDAIEITIFSLYITLLDYKTPIEIEQFKFERLKNQNLFGGISADFFNTNSAFNKLFTEKLPLDFILGNPPWGKVASSRYQDYILERNRSELKISQGSQKLIKNVIHPELDLEIGNLEISQAFLVRVSDFNLNPNMKIALVVTGKSLYNSDSTTKNWRNYFLSNFVLEQVLELSAVNNKIVGGNQIFEKAKQAPAILFYRVAISKELLIKNVITHITVKPNRFFNYFRTIVIEKHDIKKVIQAKFIERLGGYDWLWKVMLHGNLLDFYFMLRLKSFKTIANFMQEYDLEFKGGLKIKDGNNKKRTDPIRQYKFLEVETRKEFQQFDLSPSMTWDEFVADTSGKTLNNTSRITGRNRIDVEGNVGYFPDPYYFKGEKLLVKKGLKAEDNFKAVAAYSNEDLAFTSTVCAIKTRFGSLVKEGTSEVLKSLSGLINSSLFSYYIFHTSSSAGIDRTRIDFAEIFSSPAVSNSEIASLVITIQQWIQQLKGSFMYDHNAYKIKQQLEHAYERLSLLISNSFQISAVEQTLIDYSTEIALPILKRSEETGYGKRNIFKALDLSQQDDQVYLSKYANVFIDHFKHRFNSVEQSFFVKVYVADDFIGFHFIVDKLPMEGNRIIFQQTGDAELFTEVGNLGIYSVTRDLYIQQDVRGFNKNTFYIIKPNEYKCWHPAVAHHDLLEFIDALARAETANIKEAQA
ncbi:Eco57I restriction-modification methylase domain-containing protein [Pedobacter puniceum]|uniref:site-specific DNA-methyltransferase (adenine-specific) n=1 Tax=Pedobacter puniceum TaxID=2666136 RepID=A0A7K0FLY0_9SPHI|nr:DNA methyltransferase [Pedobacter puniceum]MRX46968.1 N-6 DNA methylase [Pedobacter puniceum]